MRGDSPPRHGAYTSIFPHGINSCIKNSDEFARMSIINTGKSGIFAADRAIREYADNIWGVKY